MNWLFIRMWDGKSKKRQKVEEESQNTLMQFIITNQGVYNKHD